MNFASRLRILREEKAISQKDLGEIFNLSKQAISSYENKGSSPSQETLQKMSDYFDCSTDYLLGKSNARNGKKTDLPREVEKVIRESNIMFNGAPLDEEDKEDVVKVIKLALGMKRRKQ